MAHHLPFPSSPLAGQDDTPKNQPRSPETGAGEIPQRPLGRTSTMKYDGDVGRGQHGLPSHKELPL